MRNKITTELGANKAIRDAIQKIALRGIVDPSNDTVYDAQKITGYVKAIHADGELAGTIDVQEYGFSDLDEAEGIESGYHSGVYLTAIQDNDNGMVIIPKLYSDVVVERDPVTGTEFVTMFSHVDTIQLDSHETITIRVKEREEFDNNSKKSPDIDELADTGIHAITTYQKNSISSEIQGDKDENKIATLVDDTHAEIDVSNGKTTANIDKDGATLVRDRSKVTITKDYIEHKVGDSLTKVKNGTVFLGNDVGTDDAVLGGELANILCEFLDCISQILTTTQLGPQPPLNIAAFISLKAKINAFKSAHSGFLTNKVKIQK